MLFAKQLNHKVHKDHKGKADNSLLLCVLRDLCGKKKQRGAKHYPHCALCGYPKNMPYEPIPEEDERIAHEIIGAAIEVHRVLGPGFLESVYKAAMVHELTFRGLLVEQEKPLVVHFKDLEIRGQRLDLLVNDRVIVELKTVEEVAPIFLAKLLSYLKASNLRLGLIVNFNVEILKHGIKRVVR